MARRGLPAAALAAALYLAAPAVAGEKTHTVYAGQTLGMISKRYNVSIDEICSANGISRSSPIKPGQKLAIPGPDGAKQGAARRKSDKRAKRRAEDPPKKESREPVVHAVARGHTLGKIASRYRVSVDALCHANDITRGTPIKPGQKIIVPGPGDDGGKRARRLRLDGFLDDADDGKQADESDKNWRQYAKAAWRRGYITLQSQGRRWKGYVIGPGNKVLPNAQKNVSDTLASWRTGKAVDIDGRLVELIARVSDTFGGRTVHVISGYREHSHSASSRHPKGQALDFSVEGVPNWAVRDYVRTLSDVGVGYYPNSSFVHLDVRSYNAYWVDRSRPGEAPRYAHQ